MGTHGAAGDQRWEILEVVGEALVGKCSEQGWQEWQPVAVELLKVVAVSGEYNLTGMGRERSEAVSGATLSRLGARAPC